MYRREPQLYSLNSTTRANGEVDVKDGEDKTPWP